MRPIGRLAAAIAILGACGDNLTGVTGVTGDIQVTVEDGLATTEAGSQATFMVALGAAPSRDVVIALSSSDEAEGTVSPATLRFTTEDFDAPQLVTVTGVQDDIADGSRAYRILTAPAVSDDPRFHDVDGDDVALSNTDDDSAGVTVTPTSGLTTIESGGSATFTVVLSSRPTADVALPFSSSNPGEGTVAPGTLTFTADNWNAPQTVTATGVDDDVADGARTYRAVSGAATSADGGYSGLDADDVEISNTDDDTAGITVTPAAGLMTTEAGAQATFSVALDTRPTADVTIPISSSDPDEGTADVTALTFTIANWNAPQRVTITGVDDAAADGDQTYTVDTGAAVSTDPGYSSLDGADAAVTNVDDDSAGFLVTPTSGLATTEGGGQATFTIRLASQPTANVTIGLSSSDPGEGTASAASVMFTSANWSAPQTITLTGADDAIADGNQPYTIVTAAAVSGDAAYAGRNPADVGVTNTDNDTAGVTVTPTSGLTTSEGGGQGSFTIRLGSQPTANVTIGLSSSDTSEGLVGPTSVTFTTANWNAPQTVTVTGVNDFIADGNQPYSIATAAAASADAAYDGLDANDVSATNLDNDTAGVLINPTAGLVTSEAGSSATFSIVLQSQPTANVVVTAASADPGEGTASPASVTFTTLNWNAPQLVTVTGVDDAVADGNQVYLTTTGSATSADLGYNGIDPPDVSATNIDNDSPGIRVTPTSGLTTTEGGGTATFGVVLESQPIAGVTIAVASSDATEGVADQASLTFTAANWNAPQTVTVTGADDAIADGNQPYSIILAAAASGDPGYAGSDAPDVTATNVDNDSAGVILAPTAGLTTTEAGGTDFFTVGLTSQPTADVTITFTSSDPGEGTLPIASVTFTGADWNLPRTVNIVGADDAIADGNQPYSIITSATASADPAYNGVPVPDVAVTNTDNDIAGVTIDPTSGLIVSEFRDVDTFTIVLNTAPTAAVTINLSSSDTTEATVGSASVTFTAADWNVPQTITVTGVDDAIADGNQPFFIVTAPATSADASYSGMNAPDPSGSNFDNDVPGVYVKARRLLRTSESGQGSNFRMSLTTLPAANVTCTLSTSDPTEGTVSPTTLTFTPANFATLQNVTVSGVDDALLDGDQLFTIVTAACTSADSNYAGYDPRDVSVLNRDND